MWQHLVDDNMWVVWVAGKTMTMNFPVVVTSYEIVIADVKHLQRYEWKYIIVDEGHRLKNFNCKLIRELRTIPAQNKLLLSGAPFPFPETPISHLSLWCSCLACMWLPVRNQVICPDMNVLVCML